MKRILVLGATSAMAQGICRLLAKDASFQLVGRSETRLKAVADDLIARGAVAAQCLAGSAVDSIKTALTEPGAVDLFLAAQGTMPNQAECESSPALAAETFRVNTSEIIETSLLVADSMEKARHGTIVVIGSVAGDRGRRSNYVYGASKAALETFCDGLQQRMEPICQVLLIKPGPTDTPMTAHLRKGLLFSSTEKVASDVVAAIESKRSGTVYTPNFWKLIMTIIRLLPRQIVKKLKA